MNHEDETNLKLLIAFASLLQFCDYRHVPLSPVEPLDQWFSTYGADPFGESNGSFRGVTQDHQKYQIFTL